MPQNYQLKHTNMVKFILFYISPKGFLGGLVAKNSPANAKTHIHPLGSEYRLEKENINPPQYLCLENSWTGEPG